MKRILSTRVLSDSQKALLPEGIDFQEYDAIQVTWLPVPEQDTGADFSIFTSQNAVRACFAQDRLKPIPGPLGETTLGVDTVSISRRPFQTPGCFCVGEKTAAMLITHGQEVSEVANNATALAEVLIKKYNDRSFVHFCGNLRLEGLSRSLQAAGIPFRERVVYQTELQTKAFKGPFDAVLFFSPSGVQSFTKKNTLAGTTAVCIGPTTARAVIGHTDRIIKAEKPSVEEVILAAAMTLN